MKTNRAIRGFFQSSSFSMALLFTGLLSLAAIIVGYFLYDFGSYLPKEYFPRFIILNGVIVICVTLVVFASYIIAYFVVTRINLIADTAEQIIETGDLSKRIKISTKLDDLSNLAQVLNRFLGRIENLMEGVRGVSDTIAHDLRTPLTHLRHHIEELDPKTLNDNDIEKLLIEVDRLLEIFNALLRISTLEKSKLRTSFEQVDMRQLVQDSLELFEPLAEEGHIKVIAELNHFKVDGNKNLLFQMVNNLIDNALKYGALGGEIKVSLQENGILTIADKGKGIELEERENVFQRFYRLDKSRGSEGNGLGLSLVQAIITLHNASILLEDNKPGLKIIVKLNNF